MKIKDELKDVIEKSIFTFCTIKDVMYPNAIIVACLKITDDNKILITDNFMHQTLEDLKTNSNVLLITYKGDKSYKIIGTGKYETEGKYMENVKDMNENKGLPCKGVIVVNVENII